MTSNPLTFDPGDTLESDRHPRALLLVARHRLLHVQDRRRLRGGRDNEGKRGTIYQPLLQRKFKAGPARATGANQT